MATNITFTSLIADMQAYLERGGSAVTDPTVFDQLPRLINAAERKLMQELKLQGAIEVLVDPAGMQAGNPVVTKPDRWRQTVSMSYGTGATMNSRVGLLPRAYEYCRVYWPDATQTAPPEMYADYDYQHWLVAPTPDQDYPAEFICYMQPPLLDAENQSNFWTTYCPNALLAGSIMEAAVFLKDDGRLQMLAAAWQNEIATLDAQDAQKSLDRSAQRKRP